MKVEKRIERIEEKIGQGKKTQKCILVTFPDKDGYHHGGRKFETIKEAISVLEKEKGCKLRPAIIHVEYVEPNFSEGDFFYERN